MAHRAPSRLSWMAAAIRSGRSDRRCCILVTDPSGFTRTGTYGLESDRALTCGNWTAAGFNRTARTRPVGLRIKRSPAHQLGGQQRRVKRSPGQPFILPRRFRPPVAGTPCGAGRLRHRMARGLAVLQQVRRLICARICARDAAGQTETDETQKTRDDFAPQVCRGQRGDRRLPETRETGLVRLITQRRQVLASGGGPLVPG